jgi:hypothetical protein
MTAHGSGGGSGDGDGGSGGEGAGAAREKLRDARRMGTWGKEGRPRRGKSNLAVARFLQKRYSFLATVLFLGKRYCYS